jgi:CRP-like cAMP-binding protein
MQRITLFEGLSTAACTEIALFAHARNFSARQRIFQAGDPIGSVGILISGRVKMSQLSRSGTEVIVKVQTSGDVLSMPLAPGSKHFLTAQALDPCHLLTWDARDFAALSQQFPALQRNAISILAGHLRMLEQRFLELATEHAGIRLARTLVRLLEEARSDGPRDTPSSIDLSPDELARMIGTTVFTVTRLLCDWQSRGIIQNQHENVTINDHSGLVKLAENTEHFT